MTKANIFQPSILPMMLCLVVLLLWTGCGEKEKTGATYHCPMHPTYISDHPGDCPICGMRLVPVETKTAPSPAPLFVCPMHPEVTSDKPGTCSKCGMNLEPTGLRKVQFYRNPMNPEITSPVPMKDEMGMDFVPVYSDEISSSSGTIKDLAAVTIPAEGRHLSGIKTAEAKTERMVSSIRTVGIVTPDETQIRHVHTKISGWIEKLHVNFTGQQVRKGEPILSIYSPELLASQEELIRAHEYSDKLLSSSIPEVRRGAEELVSAARRRLELFDVPRGFIDTVEKTGKTQRSVTLLAPSSGAVTVKQTFEGQRIEPGMELFTITDLSQVWVEADFYEYEARQVNLNQKATLTLPYDPGIRKEGVIHYIYPVLNPESRTIKVRFEFDNTGMVFKPDMYANVELELDAGEGVVVPDSAVIDTGLRQVVFVETEPTRFEPRLVQVGIRNSGKAQILSGVQPGENVVIKANFLLDSESRLRAALSDMSSEKPSSPVHKDPGDTQ